MSGEKEPYDASDQEQVEGARERVKTERDQELEDVKTVLSHPAGRRFFKRMFREAKMFSTTFTGNSHTFFLEGHRNLALMFFNDVCEAAPNRIPDLVIEKEEETNE